MVGGGVHIAASEQKTFNQRNRRRSCSRHRFRLASVELVHRIAATRSRRAFLGPLFVSGRLRSSRPSRQPPRVLPASDSWPLPHVHFICDAKKISLSARQKMISANRGPFKNVRYAICSRLGCKWSYSVSFGIIVEVKREMTWASRPCAKSGLFCCIWADEIAHFLLNRVWSLLR